MINWMLLQKKLMACEIFSVMTKPKTCWILFVCLSYFVTYQTATAWFLILVQGLNHWSLLASYAHLVRMLFVISRIRKVETSCTKYLAILHEPPKISHQFAGCVRPSVMRDVSGTSSSEDPISVSLTGNFLQLYVSVLPLLKISTFAYLIVIMMSLYSIFFLNITIKKKKDSTI